MKDKMTMKDRVLAFVESKGTARFVEIQKFVVDYKYGVGAYEAGCQLNTIWLAPSKKNPDGALSVGFPNRNRGYYCSMFFGSNPIFMYGESYLERMSRGIYKVVHTNGHPKLRAPRRYLTPYPLPFIWSFR